MLSQLTTGAQLTAEAFSTVFGRFGRGFVAVSLALFAFSTLLGWSYYGQRAAAYLMGERVIPGLQGGLSFGGGSGLHDAA